jgi:hypothetical protein
MATLSLDRSHLTEESLVKLAENTNLTHLAFGSKARVLHDILNDKLDQQLILFEDNIDKGFLRGAEGSLLDFFAEVYDLERPQDERAFVSNEEKNFNWFTLEANFGAINNGEDILIPKGRRVFNSPELEDDTVVYVTTQDIALPANETRVFFAARSVSLGEEVNVGENTMNFHDFTGYADALNDSLLVSNSSSIAYGQNELDDESFRFLIKQQPLAAEKANFTAIDTALRQIPGIASVTRLLYRRGIGTSDWIIKAVTPTVPATPLQLAQDTIDQTKSDGLDHLALAPDTIGLQLFFTLTYKERLEDADKTRIKSNVRRSLIDYVNSLDIGQKLILDQLVHVILNSSEQIASVGTPEQKFDKIVIFKRSEITNSKTKKVLLGDFTAEEEERVIIEPEVENPISIFDAN